MAPYKLDEKKLVTVEYSVTEANLAILLIEAVNSVEGLHAASADPESRQW